MDMHYGEGMEIRCTNSIVFKYGGDLKNKRVYTITHIYKSGFVGMMGVRRNRQYCVEAHQLYNNFIGNYASTVDGVHGV